MNRHQRRRLRAIKRSEQFVQNYVEHLPRTDVLQPGGITHCVFRHDNACEMIARGGDCCTCTPEIEFYVEPERQ